MIQHQDLIHIFQSDQPVGDEQERVATCQGKERVEDAALGQRVEVGSRFIQQEDGGILQQEPGNRQALAFAPTQAQAAFADDRLIALRQPEDKVVDLGALCGLPESPPGWPPGRASSRFCRMVSLKNQVRWERQPICRRTCSWG